MRWVYEGAGTILNSAGEVVRMVGPVQDITDRIGAQSSAVLPDNLGQNTNVTAQKLLIFFLVVGARAALQPHVHLAPEPLL